MPDETDNPFWSALDGIAVINLDDRQDRWEAVERDLAAYPGSPAPTRVSAIRGIDLPGYGSPPWFRGRRHDRQWGARAGCTLSHRKAMQCAAAKGWDTFLVLEDDACLRPLEALPLHRLHAWLFQRFPDWDICYLGLSSALGFSLELARHGDHRLCEMTGCLTAHAYLVRTPARTWILRELPDESTAWAWHAQHRIVDQWYSRHLSRQLRVLAVSPSLITQRPCFSDIVGRAVNYEDVFAMPLRYVRNRSQFARAKRLHHIRLAVSRPYCGLRRILKGLTGL